MSMGMNLCVGVSLSVAGIVGLCESACGQACLYGGVDVHASDLSIFMYLHMCVLFMHLCMRVSMFIHSTFMELNDSN